MMINGFEYRGCVLTNNSSVLLGPRHGTKFGNNIATILASKSSRRFIKIYAVMASIAHAYVHFIPC